MKMLHCDTAYNRCILSLYEHRLKTKNNPNIRRTNDKYSESILAIKVFYLNLSVGP